MFQHSARGGIQIRIDVNERNVIGMRSQELRQRISERPDDEFDVWFDGRQCGHCEHALFLNPARPCFRQSFERVETVHLMVGVLLRDVVDSVTCPNAKLEVHAIDADRRRGVSQNLEFVFLDHGIRHLSANVIDSFGESCPA